MLLPPDSRNWVPADPLAPFVIAAVEALDRRQVQGHIRGTGNTQYQPTMLLSLLVSNFVNGTTVHAALDKTAHHRSVADLEKKPEPSVGAGTASLLDPHDDLRRQLGDAHIGKTH